MPPPLGEHVKAVVTKDVPFRFADELGAQVATALAMAVFKGVVSVHTNGDNGNGTVSAVI